MKSGFLTRADLLSGWKRGFNPTSVYMQKMQFLLRFQPWPKGFTAAATVPQQQCRSLPVTKPFRVLLGKETLKCELTVHSDGFETAKMESGTSAVSSTLINYLY